MFIFLFCAFLHLICFYNKCISCLYQKVKINKINNMQIISRKVIHLMVEDLWREKHESIKGSEAKFHKSKIQSRTFDLIMVNG